MRILTPDMKCIGATRAAPGESICWSPQDEPLMWVDIAGGPLAQLRSAGEDRDGVMAHRLDMIVDDELARRSLG